MKSTSINRVIEDFNALVLDEKEFVLEIIRKMYVEAQRKFPSQTGAWRNEQL